MILYLDCFNGVAGDMLTAALADLAGRLDLDPAAIIGEALEAAGIERGAARLEEVSRAGFVAQRLVVEEREGFASFELLDERVRSSSLSASVRQAVLAASARMAAAEEAVHGGGSHLHELAGLDTAVDLIAAMSLVDALRPTLVVASPPALGGGEVETAHGRLAVPAPAVLALLEGVPTAGGSGPATGELTTPTGAALLTVLVESFGAFPAGRVRATGCGAGSRDIPGRANVLRAVWVEEADDGVDAGTRPLELLEATIDDATPELLAHAAEVLRASGALDVWFAPALMKKGRPGQVLHVLGPAGLRLSLAEVVFRETTTFGLRTLAVDRILLDERREMVDAAGVDVGVRLGFLHGRLVTASPEFEDCRRAAEAAGVPLAEVYAAAQAAAYARFGV